MAFMSCQANVRIVGKNKTGEARIIILRRIFTTIVAVGKQ
jgi:hypothetical protein